MDTKPTGAFAGETITPVRIGRVRITDPLFGGYAGLVAEKILPYQWEALNDRLPGTEKSYCIDNFRIAAGLAQGCHRGAAFQDTDLYKWLETVAFCIENGSGQAFAGTADEMIALIGRAQEPDGYLNTYFTIDCPDKKWTNLAEGHELYSGGHMIEAAVAYYNATGKKAFLQIACRFADLVDRVFGADGSKCHGYPGHQEIELALVKLYHATGEKRYLALADSFIRRRGGRPNYLLTEMTGRKGRNIFPEFYEYDDKYAQTHLPPLRQTTAEGHAVRAVYMYSAMADLAGETHDAEMADACRTLYKNMTGRRMYLTGGIGASGKLERFTTDYDLPNDRMYCESCASIGLMMFAQRMAGLTGEASYYDTVERALCNTVLAGISKEGDRYFYVNPLEVWPQNCLPSTAMSHVKPVRQKWFACACCPPNIARTLASLGQYIYAVSADRLYVNQFISSDVSAELGGAVVTLSMQADVMQSGTVHMQVACGGQAPASARLCIRIPPWFKEPVLTVDGAAQPPMMEKGYLLLPITGNGEIGLSGSVKAHFVAANRRVHADIGKLAIEKGPYVYCLEQIDNGSDLPGIYVSPAATILERPPVEGLPGALPSLELAGERLTQTSADDAALYGAPQFTKRHATVRAVPYALWCNRTPGEMQVWIKAKI